jgi:hypothetical protein
MLNKNHLFKIQPISRIMFKTSEFTEIKYNVAILYCRKNLSKKITFSTSVFIRPSCILLSRCTIFSFELNSKYIKIFVTMHKLVNI